MFHTLLPVDWTLILLLTETQLVLVAGLGSAFWEMYVFIADNSELQ